MAPALQPVNRRKHGSRGLFIPAAFALDRERERVAGRGTGMFSHGSSYKSRFHRDKLESNSVVISEECHKNPINEKCSARQIVGGALG